MKLDDLNLHDVGVTIGLVGAVFADTETSYLCMFPDQDVFESDTRQLRMNLEDWQKFMRQLDLREVEVLQRDTGGKLVKSILRKSQRVIDSRVSWAVYMRDSYRCRYCGREGIPMTVDHLVLWEEGGPSIEDNLVTACRKCNKARGNTQYADWLMSPYYARVSANLPGKVINANQVVAATLDNIPRRYSERSR